MGNPQNGCFFFGKSQSKMDENWGYPYDSGNHHRIVLTPVHGKLPRITWPAQHRTLVFGTTQGHGRSWEIGAEQTESNFGLERKLENVNETTTSECGYLEQNMNDPVKKTQKSFRGLPHLRQLLSREDDWKILRCHLFITSARPRWWNLFLSRWSVSGAPSQTRSQVTATPKWPFQSLAATATATTATTTTTTTTTRRRTRTRNREQEGKKQNFTLSLSGAKGEVPRYSE